MGNSQVGKPPFMALTALKSYCKHYKRSSCLFKFKCCEEMFFPCHKCHNEFYATEFQESEDDDNYIVIRESEHPQVSSIDSVEYKCTQCGKVSTTEEFSDKCEECSTRFAPYVCVKCKLVVNDKSLDPYHCDDCKTCRVDKSNSFHCSKCNICFNKKLKNNHKCLEDSGHQECAVCLEEVFKGCLVLPCSHKIHRDCLESVIQHKRINCPICRQCFISIDDLEKPSLWKKFKLYVWSKTRNTTTPQVQDI